MLAISNDDIDNVYFEATGSVKTNHLYIFTELELERFLLSILKKEHHSKLSVKVECFMDEGYPV